MTWHKDINCGLMSIRSLVFQKMQYKWVFTKGNVSQNDIQSLESIGHQIRK